MSSKEFMTWSDEYSINIQEIDEQHKVLVDLLNQLYRAIREHRGTATSREILGRLAEYTRTHFLLEESLMRVTHYPGFSIHKEQHQDLIQQVQALQEKIDKENAPISFELLHMLRNWLIQHINDSDRRFGVHFQMAGLAAYSNWSREVEETMTKQKKKKWWWKFW